MQTGDKVFQVDQKNQCISIPPFTDEDWGNVYVIWKTRRTKISDAINVINSDFPFILLNYVYDINTGTFTNPLFQGNKFFFTASTDAEGRELWISDGRRLERARNRTK